VTDQDLLSCILLNREKQTKMADNKIHICAASGKKIYQADKYVNYQGEYYHKAEFKCAATGVPLTLKTVTKFEGKIYLRGKEPDAKHHQVPDVVDDRVKSVPDSNMRTNDRAFQIAGNQAARGASSAADAKATVDINAVGIQTAVNNPDPNMRTGDRKFAIADGAGASQYGAGALQHETVKTTPKKPTTVQNVNMMEKMHNGTNKYTGVEEPAAE